MVDRGDRAPVASFFVEATPTAGAAAELSERANQHARVKRMEVGDVVRLIDGAGAAGIGTITAMSKGLARVDVERVDHFPQPAGVHLRAPIGDRDRMLWLAEKATEIGIESWQAVMYHRSRSVMPRGEGAAFAEKARARMISALEQSGGTWLPRILPDTTPDAIDSPNEAARVMLDRTGVPMLSVAINGPVVVTLGPEGGYDPLERSQLANAGWTAARLASTVLRFETAGVAALAVISAAHTLHEA